MSVAEGVHRDRLENPAPSPRCFRVSGLGFRVSDSRVRFRALGFRGFRGIVSGCLGPQMLHFDSGYFKRLRLLYLDAGDESRTRKFLNLNASAI